MDPLNRYTYVLAELRYSYPTIKSYRNILADFLKELSPCPVEDLTYEMVCDHLEKKFKSGLYSQSFERHTVAALKLFFAKILNKPFPDSTGPSRPRIEKTPVVLSKKEIDSLLLSAGNLKYKTFFALMYATGISLRDAARLQPSDVLIKTKAIRISQFEAEESRETLLPQPLLDLLKMYYSEYKPKNWLFEGRNGSPISHRILQIAFKNTLRRAGIGKPATLFSLRHSFAVHMLEQGTDIRIVQQILGHKSVQMTNKYKPVAEISLSNMVSPLELLYSAQE